MKALKIVFALFGLVIIALIMIVVFGLNSATFLDKSAKFAIEQSGLDIGYSKISGGLYSGLEIKDFNYQDDLKADVKVDIDFLALKEGKIKVRDINLSHLQIDKDFLQSMIKPSEKNESKEKGSSSFIKDIAIDSLHLDTKDIIYDAYKIDTLVLDVRDFHYDMQETFGGDISAHIASNVALADMRIKMQESHYDAHIDADVQKAFIAPYLSDSNVSLRAVPHIMIDAQGDMEQVEVDAKIGEGELRYNTIMIAPQNIDLHADIGIKEGDIKANVHADIDSDVARVQMQVDTDFNHHDINDTLHFTLDSTLDGKRDFVEKSLTEHNITIVDLPSLTLEAKGDLKKITFATKLKEGEIHRGDIAIFPKALDLAGAFDLRAEVLDAKLLSRIDSNIADVDLDSKVSVNIKDINDSLRYKAAIMIKDAKAYGDVDLSQLGDISINAVGSLKDLEASVKSKKITAAVHSDDFDTFTLNLDTKKLYIGKIYSAVPADLKSSFVAVKADGYYKLKSNEAEIKTKLKGFKYNRHTLYTNTFSLALKGEDITLSPLILRSDNFKMTMDVKKVGNDLVANLKNRAFYAKAKVNLDPLHVKADGEISSLKALLKEVDNIYPVDSSMGIDGKVKFRARMQGERVKATLTSPNITFKEGRMEGLNIVATYAPNLIKIKNFDFKLAGFEGKGMNREVHLAREGVIAFDEENASVNVELKDLLYFKGEKKGDVTTGRFKTKTLSLSYPEYGETKVTTDLEMYQSGEKMAVTGEVRFKETEVNYQSRFLDVSKDEDIIIVSKEKKESDNFLKNTFLDIKIVSDDAILYKVEAGEIELQPDMVVRKDFGQEQKITGKIKILGGMYDFADKRFTIKEGAVAFRGLAKVNPLLDLHVVYDEIDDVAIMIDIAGDKNRPKLSFTSEPQMSKKDIFSYLLFGMSASETEGAATSANKAAERIFGRAVAKDLARELHLDRLDMNRNADGGIDVKAGKKINRKSIIYYQNKSTESSVIYERKLSKSWDATTEVGKLGQSVDFVYRKGFK